MNHAPFLLALLGLALVGCSSNSHKASGASDVQDTTDAEADTLPVAYTYENDYFEVEYPTSWEYREEYNTSCDTLPFMKLGVSVTFYPSDPTLPWPLVKIQKSSLTKMLADFGSPEDWRDLSIELKQFDSQYIGTCDAYLQDSLTYGSYPAAMAGFVAISEDGDTLLHKQLVVRVKDEIYYLNNTFLWNDDSREDIGDAVLSSVTFKHAE